MTRDPKTPDLFGFDAEAEAANATILRAVGGTLDEPQEIAAVEDAMQDAGYAEGEATDFLQFVKNALLGGGSRA